MDIKRCRIDMKVRTLAGHTGTIVEIDKDGMIRVDFGANNYHYVPFPAANVEPIAPDACESCQHIAEEHRIAMGYKRLATERDEKITELQSKLGQKTIAAAMYRRNAVYWREELTKLQKEALAEHIHPAIHIEDFRPLGEVAKIYIQISPAVLAQIIAEREE